MLILLLCAHCSHPCRLFCHLVEIFIGDSYSSFKQGKASQTPTPLWLHGDRSAAQRTLCIWLSKAVCSYYAFTLHWGHLQTFSLNKAKLHHAACHVSVSPCIRTWWGVQSHREPRSANESGMKLFVSGNIDLKWNPLYCCTCWSFLLHDSFQSVYLMKVTADCTN